jgi:hypothetical protein
MMIIGRVQHDSFFHVLVFNIIKGCKLVFGLGMRWDGMVPSQFS